MRRMSPVLGMLLLAVTASAQLQAHYRTGTDGVLLPDPDATPGATFLVTVDQLCTAGYTKGVRHIPEAVKAQVYASYGATKQPGVCCEVDHLIPLELGGSNAVKNLWPQPYTPRRVPARRTCWRTSCTGRSAAGRSSWGTRNGRSPRTGTKRTKK
jgi:hypothetical protein